MSRKTCYGQSGFGFPTNFRVREALLLSQLGSILVSGYGSAETPAPTQALWVSFGPNDTTFTTAVMVTLSPAASVLGTPRMSRVPSWSGTEVLTKMPLASSGPRLVILKVASKTWHAFTFLGAESSSMARSEVDVAA